MRGNVVELFFQAAERHPERTAFVHSTRSGAARVSFDALRGGARAFAGGLTSRGFRTGDRAVFVLPMSPDLYVSVLGVLACGGTAVFVDPWVSLRQIARLMAAARPVAFVGTPRAHLLRLFERSLRHVPLTVSTDDLGAWLTARLRFSDLRGDGAVVSADRDAPALITFTSGSSGAPKGVTRTHGILEAQHRVIREEFSAQDGDVDLTTFPVFALSNLAAGVTTVIPPVNLRRIADANGGRVLRAMREGGVTTVSASPPLMDRIVDHLDATGGSPPFIRRIVTGGAPVTDAQLRRWSAAFPGTEIQVAYGSSEAEPVAKMTGWDRLAASGRGFCAGVPVAAVRTRVVRITRGPIETPVAVAQGEIGELLVSGPHVCREYVGDASAFRENKVRDGDGTVWHRMGDTGWFDSHGRFWIAGRVHSTIWRGDASYHAQLVEQEIETLLGPHARRVAAVGIPSRELGESLAVVIQLRSATDRTVVESQLPVSSLPVDHWVLVDADLPLDPRHNSKVDYTALRAIVRENHKL